MTFKISKWIKRLAVLLALCMLCCFTGCDGSGDQSSDLSSDSSDVGTEPKNYRKVGYIFSGDADEEFSFTWQMNQQRIMASNRCSMDTCYIDKVSIMDFETAVKKLAAEGCTEIVAASSNFTNIARSVSSKYMNLHFIVYGATASGSNLAAYTENVYQGAFVAGTVAAYNSETRKIGIVRDTDLLYNYAVVNAVALGAQRHVFKDATVYVAAAHEDSEIDKAISALIDKKCDVIICYTSSPRSAKYCQSRGVKFISNIDFSGHEDKYSNMLMYFYCKRDSYFLSQFKKMQMDQWSAENFTGNMGNGTVMTSKAIGDSKADTQLLIDKLNPYISSGAAYIFDGEIIDNSNIVRYLQNSEMSYSEIYSMDWYVRGVESVGNFREIQQHFPENSFEVKY